MRAQHSTHPLPAFPVYSCAFVASDQMVVGGGGGAAKTGIKNKLVSNWNYIQNYSLTYVG